MSNPVCPNCQASLDDDLIASTGEAECPFCGASLDPALFAAADAFVGAGNLSAADEATAIGEMTAPVGAIPADSQIKVIESTPERKILYVPAGGKQTASIGCFAILWNGFMLVFTPPWFFAGPGGPPAVVIVPFLGLFWAVGLGMLYWWMRMRFTRTYILLERDRLTVQRILFNRKSLAETWLGPESRAELVEAYQQNDVPVYSIAVTGTNGTAKFGTALSEQEKDWFVDLINEFLGVGKVEGSTPESHGLPPVGFAEELQQPAIEIPDVDPAELPPDGPITIEEANADELRASYPAASIPAVRWFIGLFMLVFSMFWLGMVIGVGFTTLFGRNAGLIELVASGFVVFMSFPGFILLAFSVFMFRGRMTIGVTRDRLSCRWHVGRLGFTKWFPTESITGVQLASGTNVRNRRIRRNRRYGDRSSEVKSCVVTAGGKRLLLTLFHDEAMSRTVAGLVRQQLHRMGHRLQDA